MDSSELFAKLNALAPEMVQTLSDLIRVSAVGPESGGEGEDAKAAVLLKILKEIGFDKIDSFDAEDTRVGSGKRPNIIAYLDGKSGAKRLWIVTHLDVVPSGEPMLWKITSPFEPKVHDGCIFGRGSEDNGQSLVASVYAIKALKQLGLSLNRSVVLAFVADEEQGSTKGIQHLISQNLFGKDDLVLVPDSGNANGDFIEVAEKSILWFKLTTIGKQAHGSMPDKGLNANRISMQTALALDKQLHAKYNARNEYFTEPLSTFEPTRKEKNVDAINIVPGEDVLYFDCRVLPSYDLAEVLEDVKVACADWAAKTGAEIRVEVVQQQAAPQQLDADSEIARLLKCALMQARGIEAKLGGVGGGTCAAFFRRAGIPAVVWSTIDEVAHQPDEYCKIANMISDAKVFALLALL